MRMMERNRVYAAIDLKSFYASVECQERGLDPLHVNLVVADESRTDKTICLAVSPSLKKYGISGRARLYEVKEELKKINRARREKIRWEPFKGVSADERELEKDPYLELGMHIAVPRMAYYMEYSTKIYRIYLKYVAEEDIHVYSIDEVFIDLTAYLNYYHMSAHDLVRTMIRDVLHATGITATAGIGTNLFLAKVAMDIVAKHLPADQDGVRIAELDEMSYRRQLWTHTPIRDFWRVGRGYADKLKKEGLFTMGDIARRSIEDEESLYKLFGVNAELLIDHAWGYEPCRISDIKAYKPSSSSVGTSQVLMEPYNYEKTKIIIREMTENLVMDLAAKDLVTDHVGLAVGYDTANLQDDGFEGEVTTDWYGRKIPKGWHGARHFERPTSSVRLITKAMLEIFEEKGDPLLSVRRVTVNAMHVISRKEAQEQVSYSQLDLFSTPQNIEESIKEEEKELEKDIKVQEALLKIRDRYGKNSIIKGTATREGSTQKERNKQIGGHKA